MNMSNEESIEKASWSSRFVKYLGITTNGMAIGLFGTLIIGTVIAQIGNIPGLSALTALATVIKSLMGAGIGLGVALALKKQGVMVVASMAAGAIGNYAFYWSTGEVSAIGDPLSCYLAAIICIEMIDLILKKKTPVDIILIPLVGLIFACVYAVFLSYYVHFVTLGLGSLIEISFEAVPFVMCVVVAALMGMALTAPISSVAIAVAINIGSVPLAAGAALIGCCTQMVGFAYQTSHDNKWGKVLAVGLGTSMLQFKNIVRKPKIWLPTIIASAILGPLALAFSIFTDSVGAGMGTCGLVGILNTFSTMGYSGINVLKVLCVAIVFPLILVFLIDYFFRKKGWIVKGDFSLESDL
jgi:uncharacterized membrane protein